MTRLNKNLRAQMVENAVAKAGVNADMDAVNAGHTALGEKVLAHALEGTDVPALIVQCHEVRKTIEGMPSLLTHAYAELNEAGHVPVNLGGMRTSLPLSCEKVSPHHYVSFAADHPFVDEFRRLDKARRDATMRGVVVRQKVKAALAPYTTVEKLLKDWPEAKELLPADEDTKAAPCTALTIAPKDLNAMIGLPTTEQDTE